ncbi:MAG: non-heme iron oxygenase ferredoxin subunit [Anaerolineales bacterium]|nr:non-heme iron oxygenase ferredoxin subunit [Chloroflexota bacterium]MBL6979802.1 non-heme iron oxygenase ferredoxin subunit [Anaerolineales bacterium]
MYNYTQIDPDKCEFVAIAGVDEIPNGERLFVEVDQEFIVVFNVAGNYYAIADLCSHDDGPLGDGEIEEYEIACPRHGARFDVRSGEALTLPAVEGIPAYPVRVIEDQIEVGFPLE